MRNPVIPPAEFRKPETIRLALDLPIGDPADVSAISAKLRKALPDGSLTATGEIDCTVTAYAAAGDQPAGWSINTSSAALEIGNYALIAFLTIGSDTIATDAAPIRLIE